jgi:mannose-6-phosphate isomerase-like protein (cupin superfamily)
MQKPIFRKINDWKDEGLGYVIFEKEAEIIESNVVKVKKGESTPIGAHHNEEEVYLVMSGRGKVMVGDMEEVVDPGTLIYIPRNASHQSTGLSDEDFTYLCVAIYLDRVPCNH